jgi:predicted nucleic acid-binding protein
MVLVDSSVWIEFFRGRKADVVEQLSALIDADEVALAAPVRLEILLGASKTELPHLRRVLSALPLLLPGPDIWTKLDTWVDRARRAGERFGAMDLLIAAIANEHGVPLWSTDADFTRMGRLGLVKLHAR